MDLSLRELLVALLLLIGVLFMLIAAIGLVRMPDLFLRASASSKGATLGVAALMMAGALHFDDLSITSRAVAVIIFMMLTAPVAAHMIGRTAYHAGVPFWANTYLSDTHLDVPRTDVPRTDVPRIDVPRTDVPHIDAMQQSEKQDGNANKRT